MSKLLCFVASVTPKGKDTFSVTLEFVGGKIVVVTATRAELSKLLP